MPQITIPKRSFRTAIRGYTTESTFGVDACLWRELLQNSLDAGATKIEASVVSLDNGIERLTVRDNGRGMYDPDMLAKAMLTYSGSEKSNGNVGGFGMAKNLIAFATDRTEILSGRNHAIIEGIDYELVTDAEFVSGCTFILDCDTKEEDYRQRMKPSLHGLKYFLARSVVNAIVTFNGEEVTVRHQAFDAGSVVKETPWGATITFWKGCEEVEEGHIPVMLRGMWMFDQIHFGGALGGAVAVNLSGESVKLLTDTRCSLAIYEHRRDLEQFAGVLAKGANTALHPHKCVRRYEGKGMLAASIVADLGAIQDKVRALVDSDELGKVFNGLLAELRLDAVRGAADALLTPGELATADRLEVPGQDKLSLEDKASLLQTLVWQPDLMIVNDQDQPVAACFEPATMSAKVQVLLTAWAELVRQFLIWNRKPCVFGVGIIFSDSAAAQYRVEEDGTVWFLIRLADKNGKLVFNASNPKQRMNIVVSAAHEVSHHCGGDSSYHGDRFVSAYDRSALFALLGHTMINRIWDTVRKSVREEKERN